MPEYPDICAYLDALQERIVGHTLEALTVHSPFFLRTAEPPADTVVGQRVTGLRRLGKRIAIGFGNDHWLVVHLMIAGRLHWSEAQDKPRRPTRNTLASLQFDSGTLRITEAGTKKRASLHVVVGDAGLAEHDPGGLEVMEANRKAFVRALTRENRTLKRALTDPRILSGIGNAYSDEILHAARLSPVTLTSRLQDDELERLFAATQSVLADWRERLRPGDGPFPKKVTAFRPEMAVHGRYREHCPVCATPVQRIRYASNETNYCPTCQTGGKVLADRALSRLLKKDWPRTVEELEKLRRLPE